MDGRMVMIGRGVEGVWRGGWWHGDFVVEPFLFDLLHFQDSVFSEII